MSFDKAFKISTQKAKSTISSMIKDNVSFSCLLQDVSITTVDGTSYPDHDDVNVWLDNMFSIELIPKQLNEKALAAMESKGIKPSKNPREILLAIVTGSETKVHFGISIPKFMNIEYDDFIANLIENYKSNDVKVNVKTKTDVVGEFIVCDFESESSLKERDDVQRYIFEELKKRKIYVPDEEEDMIFDF
jgi:hypothetical protein